MLAERWDVKRTEDSRMRASGFGTKQLGTDCEKADSKGRSSTSDLDILNMKWS